MPNNESDLAIEKALGKLRTYEDNYGTFWTLGRRKYLKKIRAPKIGNCTNTKVRKMRAKQL